MKRLIAGTAPIAFSAAGRAALLTSVVGAGLLAATAGANAQSIRVWSGYPELAPFYEHVAEGMKAEYPDINVTVEAIALREHERRVALGITSGESAELLELATSIAARYLENDLLATPPADVSAFVSDPANFGAYFVDAASYDGTVYGVPLFRGQSALYYNTDMLAAAGLDGPPTTMEEFDTYSEALTQRDGSGNPTVSGWSLRLSGGGAGITEKFWINMFQHGGEIIVPAGEGKWKANLASDAGVAALSQYLHNLYTTKTVTVEMPADAEAFEREQTAMFIRESWVIGDIASKAPDLGYATTTLPRGSIVNPVQLYVAGEGEQAEAAWKFAMASQEPENLLWLLDNIGWLPNRAGLDYSEILAKTPALDAFVSYPDTYEFFSTPAIGPIDEVMTRTAAALQAAFGNADLAGDDAAIRTYLEGVDSEINSVLSREGLLGE
ncbi:extracellular solute-binding protein [Devosia neptuniae]|jgi:multiple sugar transport system substrate-binding protein|uniref:ABC transporter substrate-binding protein n=1 Tax=Devosia TaxID=46913 RepID=UPI0022AF073F|nr:extracellular solute-binding protein [Devosia neptuniae]MCZ4348123.1 extracellular solute-binding protein [Devosia neptuniae]|tara:strand:+ start:1519 stop:2838 length:1320 start_codon:yes stop_codon:yes gene_type:complete